MGMRLHEGKLQEASQNISFFLENASTAPPMKKTCDDKGAPLLVVRTREVTPLLAHVSGVVLALCLFGNAFCQWGKSVTSSKEGKIARG